MKVTFENVRKEYEFLCEQLNDKGYSLGEVIEKVASFNTNNKKYICVEEAEPYNGVLSIEVLNEVVKGNGMFAYENGKMLGYDVYGEIDQIRGDGYPRDYYPINLDNISDYYLDEDGIFSETIYYGRFSMADKVNR